MFDTLTYANKLKEAGFTERQAQAQAEALVAVVDSNIATKQDIELIRRDMKELETKQETRFKELETAYKRDLKELETKQETRFKELEISFKRDIKELELKLEARIAEVEIKIAETKADIIKWNVGALLAAAGLFAGLVKLIG